MGAPDCEERIRRGRGAVTVAGPEAGHGRDVVGQQVAEGPGRQERVVGSHDEPGGGWGQDVRGYEAGCGPHDRGAHDVAVRWVVDGDHALGDFAGAGEVEGLRFGFVAEGDVEGCGVGEGLDQVLERVLVGGSAVFVREEVLGGSHADGGSAGDEKGFDVVVVVVLVGHGDGCSSCPWSSSCSSSCV